MEMLYPTRTCALVLALAVLLPAAPKGNRFYQEGRKAELQREYDRALDFYERALREDPENQRYIMASRRLRFVAGQFHVDLGQKLVDQGKLEEAAVEFEKALQIDPASSIAGQQLRRILELLERRKKSGAKPQAEAKAEELSPQAAARRESEALLETAQSLPRLKPLSTQPLNLKINNNSKVIFETIGKLAGINVLFDPDYQDRRFTLELTNANLYEALDYVSTLARAYWKPLSANAIFVTNDNTTKRRDFEEYIVKTFYLSNAYTAQELQEIATMVRSVTDIRRVFTINSLNAMVIRGTADQLALAEKVINDVDKSRAEVIIDVLVLEASQSRTRELGITPVSGSTPGINIPIAFTPGGQTGSNGNGDESTSGTGSLGTLGTTSSSSGASIPLNRVTSVGSGDFSLTLPGASIKALMSRSDTRVLQSPRVRGFDGYKASLRIGDRIPIATGSFQPGIGGVGINPLVNTQFNYQDVGVVLDLTPKIHAGKEVSMHVEIEISNVRDRIDIGGISQPVIGQRKIIHDIRLMEGEGSIIGGLNQTQTTRSISGVPLLEQIPILGRLFSSERLENAENEILIVLLPHVVRVPDITDLNLRSVSAGTDQTVKLNFAPAPNDHPALPPAPAAAPKPAAPAPQPAPPPAPTPDTQPPTPAPTVPAPPSPTPETQPPTPAPAAPAPPQPGAARLRFDRPAVQATPGTQVTLNLVAENVAELFGVPLKVSFDPKALRLVDARRGALLANDGQDVIFSKNVLNDTGEATINLSRFPGSGGISGSGVLLILEFEAAAPATTSVNISNIAARNARQEAIALENTQAEVTIK
jgi:general secretion pathway protein D